MDIFIASDVDGFIHGVTDTLESAKALIGPDTLGATLAWRDTPLGGSDCYIDRHNGWGPQSWALIDRHELLDTGLELDATPDLS